jgi:trimethylamine--corrinoid protein Co-methyltransferase
MARRRARKRELRLRREALPLADKPFRHLQNPLPPVEVLSLEQVERIHAASMRILEEIGLDFWDAEALDVWGKAGARVDRATQHVWMDRGLVLEAVAKVPDQFTLAARNPARSIHVGGNHINFVTVGGAPYFSSLDDGRVPGSIGLFKRMVKLAHQCGPLHVVEGLMLEPQDLPVPVRHLEKGYVQFTLTDKAITTASHGRAIATDYVHMAAIVFGGLEQVQSQPVFGSVVNVNSPLRYDERMLGGLITYAKYGQPVIVTPFILAGAMSPVTLAAALAQQNAEALAGIALTQLINPGVPVVYGGFTTNIDMQTGSPAFGTPEGALALFSGAQLARHYGLPYRGSGGLNNAKIPDAQASYETQMTLWPAILAHTNIILHSAGWLEAGLVCSMEKFILDMEGLAMMGRFLEGVEITEETLALDAIADVGPGGHHFGTGHTMAHYQDAFYLPIVSDRQDYGTWLEQGGLSAAQRANRIAKRLLEAYEPPAVDPAVEEALQDYVARRKRELGMEPG